VRIAKLRVVGIVVVQVVAVVAAQAEIVKIARCISPPVPVAATMLRFHSSPVKTALSIVVTVSKLRALAAAVSADRAGSLNE
jgi:hypothetical protein